MAASWASHSSWSTSKQPSFASRAEKLLFTAWEAVSSAGEDSRLREMRILHTRSKRTALCNWLCETLRKAQQCVRVTATQSLEYRNKKSFPFLTGNSTVWDNKTERAAALKIQPAQNKLFFFERRRILAYGNKNYIILLIFNLYANVCFTDYGLSYWQICLVSFWLTNLATQTLSEIHSKG